jgi:hypothetical protein
LVAELAQQEAVREAAAAVLNAPVIGVTELGGGRNSRVFRFDGADGGRCVGKVYFRQGDPRDRLGTEWAALQFLHRHGIGCVPAPLAAHRRLGLALYEYLEGMPVPTRTATQTDIDEAVALLVRLHRLRRADGAADLPPASEACFSLRCLLGCIERRLQRLEQCRGEGAAEGELKDFLSRHFRPALLDSAVWAMRLCQSARLRPEEELGPQERTLSPSDFGFHNALRRHDGRLAFVDFEHFGWDDPAKMIADFLHHPGMPLDHSLRGRFLAGLLPQLDGGHDLRVRIRLAYVFFGLKWALILLNELVPEHLQRRRFAGEGLRTEALQLRQLDRARGMLEAARGACEVFPYESWVVA